MYENANTSQSSMESGKGIHQDEKMKQKCKLGGMSPWWKCKSMKVLKLDTVNTSIDIH